MKPATAPKLIEVLRNSKTTNEEAALVHQSKQAHINTKQEILDFESKLNSQDQVIEAAITANPFSASKLYVARMEKELMQRKYDALVAIEKELF